MTTQEHLCELKCGTPAPTTKICKGCVQDLKDEIDQFSQDDLDELLMIARRDIRPATRNRVKAGGRNLRQDALNVPAWTLWKQLTQTWPDLLPTLQEDQNAVPIAQQIYSGCKRARALIHGEPETRIDPDQIEKQVERIGSMTPVKLSQWFRENMNLSITPKRIQKWKDRGQLKPRATSERANYYHPADVLRTLQNMS
jgi:hypothetical protein